MKQIEHFEEKFLTFIKREMITDAAHDINHVHRVVKIAKNLCKKENGNEWVVIPSAYLHDCFSHPKNHPERSHSSTLAARKAIQYLGSIQYPSQYYDAIFHAIEAHSYSAAIETKTADAKIVQDADRLDSLGAIGIARCIQVGSSFEASLYSATDPFCSQRKPEDTRFSVDHFFTKLFVISETMHTNSAKIEATKRRDFMLRFLDQLDLEI